MLLKACPYCKTPSACDTRLGPWVCEQESCSHIYKDMIALRARRAHIALHGRPPVAEVDTTTPDYIVPNRK